MPTLPILQVDAFTDRPLAGNPCAVVLDADVLDEAQMQAIALEMNLSETAFVVHSEVADFGARYFTPAEEIPLAGHPTIATTMALVEVGQISTDVLPKRFSLELKAGVITVDLSRDKEGSLVATMTQMKPKFLRTYAVEDIARMLSLLPEDLRPGSPIQTVSTGTPMLMVPLTSHDALRRASLDLKIYASLRESGDFFSPHLFCMQGVTTNGITFARHLSAPPDRPEDPFTGSATGCMAAYLWHYRLIDSPTFLAEQGHWMGRPGRAEVQVVGPQEDIQSVRVGGVGVTVLKGELTI